MPAAAPRARSETLKMGQGVHCDSPALRRQQGAPPLPADPVEVRGGRERWAHAQESASHGGPEWRHRMREGAAQRRGHTQHAAGTKQNHLPFTKLLPSS